MPRSINNHKCVNCYTYIESRHFVCCSDKCIIDLILFTYNENVLRNSIEYVLKYGNTSENPYYIKLYNNQKNIIDLFEYNNKNGLILQKFI